MYNLHSQTTRDWVGALLTSDSKEALLLNGSLEMQQLLLSATVLLADAGSSCTLGRGVLS